MGQDEKVPADLVAGYTQALYGYMFACAIPF